MLKIINNNNKLLKKIASCWLQIGQASFARLFVCSRLRGLSLALLQIPTSFQPSSPAYLGPTGSGLHPPQGYGMHTGPSLPGVSSPQGLGCGLSAPPPPREQGKAGLRGHWSFCCRRIPQTAPECLLFFFFFLRNSSCSILPLHTRKGLSSHTAHLSS